MVVVNFIVMLIVAPLGKSHDVASAAQLLKSTELILQSFDPVIKHVLYTHMYASAYKVQAANYILYSTTWYLYKAISNVTLNLGP